MKIPNGSSTVRRGLPSLPPTMYFPGGTNTIPAGGCSFGAMLASRRRASGSAGTRSSAATAAWYAASHFDCPERFLADPHFDGAVVESFLRPGDPRR